MVEILIGEEDAAKLKVIILSNNTVERIISGKRTDQQIFSTAPSLQR